MHTNPVVEQISSWDKEEIASLYKDGGWWKEEYKTEDLHYLIQGSFAFVIATHKKTGKAIGTGCVIADGVSDGYIKDPVVLPQYSTTGTGTQIVAALVSRCLQSGITWNGLIAEPDTEKFSLPLGFSPMERQVPLIFQGES